VCYYANLTFDTSLCLSCFKMEVLIYLTQQKCYIQDYPLQECPNVLEMSLVSYIRDYRFVRSGIINKGNQLEGLQDLRN
jgi:hypothetical protein